MQLEYPGRRLMDNNSARTEFKQLIARGKEQGYLTIDEINDLIPPDIISGDQLSVFIQTFIDMGITVCDTPPEADDLLLNGNSQTDAEDVEIVANQLDSSVDIGRTTDPVRMYMREMGNVSLLTRKDEIEISKRIDAVPMRSSFAWLNSLKLWKSFFHVIRKASRKIVTLS